jgi:hypothetical protein
MFNILKQGHTVGPRLASNSWAQMILLALAPEFLVRGQLGG